MKKIILILTCIVISTFAFAGDKENIINALKQGNADQLSQYFDNVLDIKLPAKEEIKSIGKNQATFTVRNFFNENSISGFELTSQREMNGTMYLAGKLTGKGQDYNITLMMKSKADKVDIVTIRISE